MRIPITLEIERLKDEKPNLKDEFDISILIPEDTDFDDFDFRPGKRFDCLFTIPPKSCQGIANMLGGLGYQIGQSYATVRSPMKRRKNEERRVVEQVSDSTHYWRSGERRQQGERRKE